MNEIYVTRFLIGSVLSEIKISSVKFFWLIFIELLTRNPLKIDAWLKSMLGLFRRRLYDWIRFSVISLEWLVRLERSIISIGNIFKYTKIQSCKQPFLRCRYFICDLFFTKNAIKQSIIIVVNQFFKIRLNFNGGRGGGTVKEIQIHEKIEDFWDKKKKKKWIVFTISFHIVSI